MMTFRRVLAPILLAASTAVAQPQQPQPSIGEARVVELANTLRLGRRDSLEAFIRRSFVVQNVSAAEMALFLNYYQGFFHLARGAEIRTRDVNPHSAAAYWYSPLLEEWYATSQMRVDSVAPHRILGMPRISRIPAPSDAPAPARVAGTEQEKLQEIGDYLKRVADAGIFSGAVVIAREGKPVFAQGHGYADREKKIPNTVETPFLLGSMNKLFTGVAVGQLVEQGKLSYDDPLAKFLPDFPDPESAKRITIKHLLSHTSGLAREGAPIDSTSIDRPTTIKAMVDAFERKPLAFEPGTKMSYSNMGFVLLGRVIEVVTGQDYYDYMQKQVFAPAGATSAGFPLLPRNGVAVVPMAYPYEPAWDSEGRLSGQNVLGRYGRRGSSAGSGVASALDILRLLDAMKDGRIVKPETFRLHSSAKPELGSPNYGYGFIAGPYLGRPFVGHNGRSWGQCTEFGELRDTPYTIVVLSNLKMDWCRPVTEKILRVLRPSEAIAKTAKP
jgi:CubicO group peptidase (beta-lactamase class C family)